MTGPLPHRRKALPVTQSILWTTGGDPLPAADYVFFMHQRALNALRDHLRSTPDQGVLGFLLGHLYEDPGSMQRFAVIDLVMRLTVAIYGDKTTVVVSRVWDKMQEELQRSGAQLLGWYHSHPGGGIELTAGDLETHGQYFGEAWQAALVLGSGAEGAAAGLYRPKRGSAPGGILPFYELLDPRSVTPDGKKKSSVRWANYKPQRPPPGVSVTRSGPVPAIPAPEGLPPAISFKAAPAPPGAASPPARSPAAAPPAPSPPPTPPLPPPPPMPTTRTLASEQVPVGFVEPAAAPAPADGSRTPTRGHAPASTTPRHGSPRTQPRFLLSERPKRRGRVGVILGLLALLAAGGAAAWYFVLGPGAVARAPEVATPRPAPGAPRAPADTAPADSAAIAAAAPGTLPPAASTAPAPASPAGVPPERTTGAIDRLSDSLVAAIQSYQERARLYESGLRDCTVLARGLVRVEGGWAAYNAEKRTLTAQLDDARTQRDLLLYSSVDTVEAHYDRSGCRRP